MRLSADLDAPVAPGKANHVNVSMLSFRDLRVQRVRVRVGPVTRVLCGPTTLTAGTHVFMANVTVPERLPPEVPVVVEVDDERVETRAPVTVPERREPVPFAPSDPRLWPLWMRLASDFHLEPRGHALVARRGGVVARIQLEPRRYLGTVLAARFAYPSLGLGLLAGTAVKSGRKGDLASYSHMLYGTARDVRQTSEWFRQLGWVLDGPVVSWLDDTSLTAETLFARIDGATLRWFVQRVLGIAVAIDTTRARIMPPGPMRGYVGAWGKIAEELGGTLFPGDLSIRATWRGAEVEMDMAYQQGGYGTAMRVTVRPAGGGAKVPTFDAARGVLHAEASEDGEAVHVDVVPPFEDPAGVVAVVRGCVEAAAGGPYR